MDGFPEEKKSEGRGGGVISEPRFEEYRLPLTTLTHQALSNQGIGTNKVRNKRWYCGYQVWANMMMIKQAWEVYWAPISSISIVGTTSIAARKVYGCDTKLTQRLLCSPSYVDQINNSVLDISPYSGRCVLEYVPESVKSPSKYYWEHFWWVGVNRKQNVNYHLFEAIQLKLDRTD